MQHVCFVCADDTPPLLHETCACHIAVHRVCLQRMIDTVPSHRKHCAVCRTPYTLRRGHRCECDAGKIVCLLIKGATLLATGGGLMCLLLPEDVALLGVSAWTCIVAVCTLLEATFLAVDSCEVRETLSV